MPRGRTLFWTIVGTVIAAVVVVIALSRLDSGTPSSAASSPAPTSARTQPSGPPTVSTPVTSRLTYLSDLHPAGGLGELVRSGPVTISGAIYPKSISFYCDVGDPTAFPAYPLKHNARRFQATIGLPPGSPSAFQGILFISGDGHRLRTVTVSDRKPKTIDINVKGVHTLRLECWGSGNSYTGGEAIAVGWGNARIASAG